MKCDNCNVDSGAVYRQNETGVKGIFWCATCNTKPVDEDVQTIVNTVKGTSMTQQELTPAQLTELTYVGFVGGKAKPGYEIQRTLTPQKCHLLHMAIGVVGEVNELLNNTSRENVIEECGDMEFFLIGLQVSTTDFGAVWTSDHELAYLVDDPKMFNPVHTYKRMADASNEILDLIMKHAIRNKPLAAQKITDHMRALHYQLASIYKYIGVTRAEVLEENKKKLDVRYAAGYSDAAAEARADKPAGE